MKAKYTIKNPRKIVWAMRDFINSAHDLQYEAGSYNDEPMPPVDASFEEFCAWLRGCKLVYEKRTVKMVSVGKFCAFIHDADEYFRIGYDINDIASNSYPGDTDFMVDIYKRCPMTRGFASITLALLHELGHIYTNEDIPNWDDFKRQEEIEKIHNQFKTHREINFAYFKLPDETAATDWAIAWLQDAEHRKMAKAFEKKFFACLKKN